MRKVILAFLVAVCWQGHAIQAALGQTAPQAQLGTAQPSTKVQLRVNLGNHRGVLGLAYSPDSKLLVSGGGDDLIRLWDAQSAKPIRTINAKGTVSAVAFHPKGQSFVSAGWDHSLRLWDLKTGEEVRQFKGHADQVLAVAFSPDGSKLASAGADATVRLWDASTGRETARIDARAFVQALAFHPDGQHLAFTDANLYIHLWNINLQREVAKFEGHGKLINTLSFHKSGKLLASGSADKSVRIWNIETRKAIYELVAHKENVRAVSFSANGELLGSVGGDGKILLWETASGKLLRDHASPNKGVNALSFSPDGKRLAAGGTGGLVGQWELAGFQELLSKTPVAEQVAKVALQPSGQEFALAQWDGTLTRWSLRDGKPSVSFKAHEGPVRSVAFHPDGKRMATSGNDGSLKIWGVNTPEKVIRSERGQHPIVSSKFSPDGKFLAWAGGNFLSVVDSGSGTGQRSLEGHSEAVNGLAFSSDSRQIVSASSDGTVRLWDLATGAQTRQLAGHTGWVYSVAFVGGSDLILSGGGDGSARLWHQSDEKKHLVLKGHEGSVFSVAAHPTLPQVVSGDSTGAIRIWDANTGQLQRRLEGHVNAIFSLSYSADGSRMMSTSADRTSKLWKTSDGTLLASFIALEKGAWLTLTPEGYFSTSSYEAADVITVVEGLKAQGLGDFWDVFYRPDLVVKKLAGEDITKDTAGITFETVLANPPPRGLKLELDPNAYQTAKAKLSFEIPDSGGGIGEVRIFHNGKLIASDGYYRNAIPVSTAGINAARQASSNAPKGQKQLCASEQGKPNCIGSIETELLAGEINEFAVLAFNASNTVQGVTAKVSVHNQLPKRLPKLWVLPIGINQFNPAQRSFGMLKNAVNDARDFTDLFITQARGVFNPDQIVVVGESPLSSPTSTSPRLLLDLAATKQAILAKLDEIATAAQPEDTFVWFISSHGTIDSQGSFGIVPSNVDEARSNLIQSTDILEKSKAIRAMTQLFVFDTCHSGALDTRLSGLYDARMAALSKNMGLHLLASAQATEAAFDSDGKGNGLFTGQLLAALKDTQADLNKDGMLSIVELGRYAQAHTMQQSLKPGTLRGAKLSQNDAQTIQAPQTPLTMHFGLDRALTLLGSTNGSR